MAKLSFFIGKGGVGKTTLAAAFAVRAAARQRREAVLLVSTDPAHSLADIFETRLGDMPRPIRVSASTSLRVWQINPAKQFRKFIGRHRESILDLVESGTIFTRREIEPLLDATLPGMAEFAALLAIRDLVASGRYSEIVVDTAPLGHTLRLFEMPGHFARFLEFLNLAASRDRVLAERFGGAAPPSPPLVSEWRGIVSDVQQAFSRERARITLVTTPETFALHESVRAAEALSRSAPAMAISAVILRILDLLGRRRTLLIDMAPTGHGLELLRMPERLAQWSRLLLKTLAPHRTLPLAQDAAVEIAAIGQRVRDLVAMLRDPRRVRVWPVMLAETLPDRETGRLLHHLLDMGIFSAPVFVNRVVFKQDVGHCARCRRKHSWQMTTLANLRRRIPELYIVRDFGHEIAGGRALKAFTRELWHVA